MKRTVKINKTEKLKNDLMALFDDVQKGKCEPTIAKTLIGVTNAICNVAKVELDIAKFNKPVNAKAKAATITL